MVFIEIPTNGIYSLARWGQKKHRNCSFRQRCMCKSIPARVGHRSSITSMNNRLDHSYWTSGKEKGLILLRERILNNWLYKNDLSKGSGPSQLRQEGKFRAFYDQSPTAFEPGISEHFVFKLQIKRMTVAAMRLLLIARVGRPLGCTINKEESTCVL